MAETSVEVAFDHLRVRAHKLNIVIKLTYNQIRFLLPFQDPEFVKMIAVVTVQRMLREDEFFVQCLSDRSLRLSFKIKQWIHHEIKGLHLILSLIHI